MTTKIKAKTENHKMSFYLVRRENGYYYASYKPYLEGYFFSSNCPQGISEVAPFFVMEKGEYRRLRLSSNPPKNKDVVILHRNHNLLEAEYYYILNNSGEIIKYFTPFKVMLRAMSIKKGSLPNTLYLYEI